MEFTPDQNKVIDAAIKQFGVDHQVDLAIEECSEVTKAINKFRRLGGITYNGIIPPSENSSTEYCLAFFALCSEIADVKIMMAQLEKLIGPVGAEAVKISQDRKIDRLSEKINICPERLSNHS